MSSPQLDLKEFLADARRPEGTLTYDQLNGFLFAVLNGPELVPPSEWMEQVFAEADLVSRTRRRRRRSSGS